MPTCDSAVASDPELRLLTYNVRQLLTDVQAEYCGGGPGAGKHPPELPFVPDAREHSEIALEQLRCCAPL